jgi:catechol 2,3-dioxygenase-like lactoylglutathione lyase family enzyme
MKKITLILLALAASFGFGFLSNTINKSNELEKMKLGAFSVSLSVKDINASKKFYENLGFIVFGGGLDKNYLIMKNESTLIGLFQGMFDGNLLTFNPGWDENAKTLKTFIDVREIQQHLKTSGIKLSTVADEKTKGAGSFMVTDPDGNTILFDQHI